MNPNGIVVKFIAVAIAFMIVTSSVAILRVMAETSTENETESVFDIQSIPSRPCEVKTVLSQALPWVSFDSTPPGTPAEANVLISDTTGITIVADFYGFYRGIYNIGATPYDDLNMPGAGSINEPGAPMLPVLTELVEIPHGIDVSIKVLASSNSTINLYNVRPAPPPAYPVGIGEHSTLNETSQTTTPQDFFGPEYQNAIFPGVRTRIWGELAGLPLIVRGHRLLELSFYPVQYSPATGIMLVFSQLVVKIEYSSPAQIQPVRESLRSEVFERILNRELIHYDPTHIIHTPQPGEPISYIRTELPPSMPNTTVPGFHLSSMPQDYEPGAEYLIITTGAFKIQAQRLAEWKERKGILSRVEIISDDISRADKISNVMGILRNAYDRWYPAPTYVLLFGDVEAIPTNYDMIHPGKLPHTTQPFFQVPCGNIASDLGYFNLEGHSYFPDMIYSRISVDTEEQAQIIVNKIIQYEQSPPAQEVFYNSIMTAGYFEDKNSAGKRDGIEQNTGPFIYHLERARIYLRDVMGYNVHYNYSCAANHQIPQEYHAPLDSNPDSKYVDYTLEGYEWLWGYDNLQIYYEEAKDNITANINEGRFLVLYYSHGGSSNMFYPRDWAYDVEEDGLDGIHDNEDRDLWDGWSTPYFDTSYFTALDNGDMTPLIVSIACNTGWFDGETDQLVLDFDGPNFEDNPFADVNNESFAEEILRLEAGAIAAIASSRPAPSKASADLLNGIIQAVWPGYLEDESQPIYEMGGILLDAKIRTARKWMHISKSDNAARQIFEEFHLFGDPETQLWTAYPSQLDVTHPVSIGTLSPQKFVVTVRNSIGELIDNAKVCIQQDPYTYQVGYTDSRGQVLFEIDPPDQTSLLNVTVTKHNHVPYLGEIPVSYSRNAKVTVSPESALRYESLLVNVSGFNQDNRVYVYFDEDEEQPAIVFSGAHLATKLVPDGPYGYVNVRAEQGDLVATTCFLRLETNQNPDPFIYSYADYSTWYLAGEEEELVWDNPCITIFDGTTPVKNVIQDRVYTVNVTVHNRGSGDASPCSVKLLYAQFGGGVTWEEIDTIPVEIPLSHSREVSFSWSPSRAKTACLKVMLDANNEKDEDKDNNVGYECWNVLPVCAKVEGIFEIGNPSEEPQYVFINVKQVGHQDDVWSASVVDYSLQRLSNDVSDSVALEIDPSHVIGRDESRLFTAEFYIQAELIGGLAFEGICEQRGWLIILAIIIMVVAFMVLAIVWYIRKEDVSAHL